MAELQSSEAILNDLFSSIENNCTNKLPKSENDETEDEDSDSDDSKEKKVSEVSKICT